MSNAQLTHGSTIKRSIDGGTTWEVIPEMQVAPVPKSDTDYVDVTTLDSPGGFKEYIPGLKDGGELELKGNYTRAGYVQQAADEASGDLIMYESGFANGDKFVYSGYPSVSVETTELGEARKMTVGLKISGKPEFTAGA